MSRERVRSGSDEACEDLKCYYNLEWEREEGGQGDLAEAYTMGSESSFFYVNGYIFVRLFRLRDIFFSFCFWNALSLLPTAIFDRVRVNIVGG